jgi:hypothetical protein
LLLERATRLAPGNTEGREKESQQKDYEDSLGFDRGMHRIPDRELRDDQTRIRGDTMQELNAPTRHSACDGDLFFDNDEVEQYIAGTQAELASLRVERDRLREALECMVRVFDREALGTYQDEDDAMDAACALLAPPVQETKCKN